MARELVIRITADDSDARAKLASTDREISSLSTTAKATGARISSALSSSVQSIDEKFRGLGRSAMAQFDSLGQGVSKRFDGMKASAIGMVESMSAGFKLVAAAGGAMAGLQVVQGLQSLISRTIDYADKIADLSDRMGVSAETTQRWKFAADQTGSSIETVSQSVIKLSDGLAGGNKGLKQALTSAGLSFDEIRKMRPEDAFNKVVEAIGRVPDPMMQADLALQAFGRSGAELLPAIRQGFSDIASEASVMSESTVRALAEAKDKWEELQNNVTVATGGMLALMLQWKEFHDLVTLNSTKMAEMGGVAVDVFRQTETLAGKARAALQNQLVPGLTSAADALKEYNRVTGTTMASDKKHVEELLRKAEAFQKNVDVLTGNGLVKEIASLTREVAAAEQQGGLSAYQYEQLGKKLEVIVSKGGVLTDRLQQIRLEHERLNPSIKLTADAYKMLGQSMNWMNTVKLSLPPIPINTLPSLTSDPSVFVGNLEEMMIYAGKYVRPIAKKTIGESLKEGISDSLIGMGPVIIGALTGGGGVGRAVGLQLGSDIGANLATSLGPILQKTLGKSLGGMLGGMLGPLGGLVGGFLGGALDGIFGGNDTKKMRERFASDMGMTLDQLYKDLQSRGSEGQALANQALNVIGKGDTAAQQQWFVAVTALFDKQKAAAADAAKAVEDAAQRERAAIDTVREKYQVKIDEIQSQMDSLSQSIAQEAPEEIMGVVEAQERAALAQLEIQKQSMITQQEEAVRAAENALGGVSKKILEEASSVRLGIEAIFRNPIPVSFSADGLRPGAPPSYAAAGGWVTPQGVQYYDTGGWVRRGSDSVPAMLSPGEFVMSRRGVAALSQLNRGDASGIGAAGDQHITLNIGEERFVDFLLKASARRKRTLGLRPS